MLWDNCQARLPLCVHHWMRAIPLAVCLLCLLVATPLAAAPPPPNLSLGPCADAEAKEGDLEASGLGGDDLHAAYVPCSLSIYKRGREQ